MASHFDLTYSKSPFWVIPVLGHGVVSIYNKDKELITKLELSMREETLWQGMVNGKQLSLGEYSFELIMDEVKKIGTLSITE